MSNVFNKYDAVVLILIATVNCSEFAEALNDTFTGFLKHQQLRLMGTQGVFLAQNWPLGGDYAR